MPHTPESLLAALTALNIPYENHHHEAAFTVEQSEGLGLTVPGTHIKNLFVKDKAKNYYLITAEQHRAINLAAVGKHLGSKDRLSFADETALYEHLGVTPGSVTPLALINAKPGALRFILDTAVIQSTIALPHPLINTQTTSLKSTDLTRAIESWGHKIEPLDLGLFPRIQ